MHGGRVDQVIVVQHQHKALREIVDFVDQEGCQQVNLWQTFVLQQALCLRAGGRGERPDRGNQVGEEDNQVVVIFVEGQPGHGEGSLRRPGRHQGRLAVPHRRHDEGQVAIQLCLQPLDKRLALHQAAGRPWDIEFRAQQGRCHGEHDCTALLRPCLLLSNWKPAN